MQEVGSIEERERASARWNKERKEPSMPKVADGADGNAGGPEYVQPKAGQEVDEVVIKVVK